MAAKKNVVAKAGKAKKTPAKKAVPAKASVKATSAKKSPAGAVWKMPADTVISVKRGGKSVTAILKGAVTVEIIGRTGQYQSVKASPAKKAAAGKMPTRYDVDPPDKTKKKRT